MHQFAPVLAASQDVNGEGGRERGEGRSAGREAGHDQPQQEEDAHHLREAAIPGYGGEQVVSLGHGQAVQGGILVQVHAQEKEEGDHYRLQQAGHDEVLLRVPHVLAGQGALHHVLVQAGGRHHGEQAPQQLFPEILGMIDVVEIEYAHQALVRRTHFPADQDQAKPGGAHHEQGLEDIHADDGFHAAAHGVEPHQQHGNHHRHPERNPDGTEQEQLQGGAHQKQPGRCPQHLGQEEKPGSCLVGAHAVALVQVLVHGHDAQAEIEGGEDKGYHQKAQDEAQGHLEIAESHRPYHARDGNESDS